MTPLAIIAAALNTLWESATLAGLTWLAMKSGLGARFNAATRGAIWWAVLAMLLVLPVVPRHSVPWSRIQTASYRTEAVGGTGSYTLSQEGETGNAPPAIVTLPGEPAATWPLVAFALWAVIFAYRVARIVQSYLYLRSVKRDAALSHLKMPDAGRHARVLTSHDIVSPMAVGFLKPAIILPVDLTERLSGAETEQILLHEAAHLARRDDWTNLMARLFGAVLTLHPIAWWVLRRIEFEREAACDDWVVARTGTARPYAEALAHMVELRWQRSGPDFRREALASGVFGRGSRIGDRIEMLLERGREFSSRVSRARVAVVCVALGCLAAAGSFVPGWIAFAKAPEPNRTARPAASATPVPPASLVPKDESQKVLQVAQAVTAVPSTSAAAKAPARAFEAASVKAFPSTDTINWIRPRVEDSQRFRGRTSVEQFMEWAYGVRRFQILGLSDWLDHEQFDIEATAASPTDDDSFRPMMQRLLADRFKLKLHRETRNIPVYALSVGKNGPKMQLGYGTIGAGEINVGHGQLIAESTTMPLFVRILTDNMDRPVLDKTGLDGHYDFVLRFDFVEGAAWAPIGPALFTLVQDLGLKLEPRKADVEMLVIDSVDHPAEN